MLGSTHPRRFLTGWKQALVDAATLALAPIVFTRTKGTYPYLPGDEQAGASLTPKDRQSHSRFHILAPALPHSLLFHSTFLVLSPGKAPLDLDQ